MLEYNYLLNATEEDLIKMEALMRFVGTNFWSTNPTKIVGAVRVIQHVFHGRIPCHRSEIEAIKHIGVKIGPLIIQDVHDIPVLLHIVCDTHVTTVLPRWNWTRESDPSKIGDDVEKWSPNK